jgi:hypothetical protein
MYNLGHLGLYKNIPKKRMFNSTPDYANDAYTLLQYKSHLRNEFLIPLKANGDGSGVATIRLQSLETQTIKITGNGRFYTDVSGATELGIESTIDNTLGSLYVKVPAGDSCYLVCKKADKLTGLGGTTTAVIEDGANIPFINYCAINYPLINLSIIRLAGVLNSSFTGSINNTPSLVRLIFTNNVLSSFTGSTDSTPDLIYLVFENNLLSSFTGDIGKIVNLRTLNSHINTNCAFTYVTRRNNWAGFDTLWVSCASMTSAMVDNVLIDLDASGAMGLGSKRINLNGLCGAVTSASAAARASLVSKGFTVIVNET